LNHFICPRKKRNKADEWEISSSPKVEQAMVVVGQDPSTYPLDKYFLSDYSVPVAMVGTMRSERNETQLLS
jgi:hypothetical protein